MTDTDGGAAEEADVPPAFGDDRLSELVRLVGGATAAGKIVGASRNTIYDWTSGRTKIPFVSAAQLAAHAGVSLDWLAYRAARPEARALTTDSVMDDIVASRQREASGLRASQRVRGAVLKAGLDRGMADLEARLAAASKAERYVPIPRLDVAASAGFGRFPGDEDSTSIMMLSERWLRTLGIQPRNAQILTAVGDSMEPTIRDGDLLLVDRGINEVVDNGIYVLVVAGLVVVKRVQARMDRSLTLISDNRERYDPETIGHDRIHELTIEGRVRWYGRSI